MRSMRILATLAFSLSIVTYTSPATYLVHADDAVPMASPSDAPSAAAKIDAISAKVDVLGSKIPMTGIIVTGLGLALDFGLRLVKSQKALGIIHGLGALFRGIGGLFAAIGRFFGKMGELSDLVLPQRTK